MAEVDQLDRKQRLHELGRYDILDTPAEEAFDRITRLVCRLFGVKMSTITLIDGHRQWFKSSVGTAANETARRWALCRTPILEDRPLVVSDLLADRRFRENPFITDNPFLRFYAGVPIRSHRGVPIGVLCAMDTAPKAFHDSDLATLLDLGKLVETELDLRLQASVDSVTRALPRLAFLEAASRGLASAVDHCDDFSIIVFDIDRFKAINDEHGHSVGDVVLRHVARVARRQLRQTDVLGRLSGEEFAVAFPHSSAGDALMVAERLRMAIKREPLALPDRTISVTASFGVAWLDQPFTDVDQLTERAMTAMQQAKANGRDCSVLWEGASEMPAAVTRRVLKAGQIVFDGGRSVVDCTVRRMSDAGGRIDVSEPEAIPPRFELSIPSDAFSRACTIVEQNQKHLEIVFEEAA